MGAKIHGYIDEAEDFELDPGPSHQVHGAPMDAIAAQGVLEKCTFTPDRARSARGFGKRI